MLWELLIYGCVNATLKFSLYFIVQKRFYLSSLFSFNIVKISGLDGPQRVSLYSRYYKGIPEGCDHPYDGPYSNFLDAYPEEDERIVFPQSAAQSAFGTNPVYLRNITYT